MANEIESEKPSETVEWLRSLADHYEREVRTRDGQPHDFGAEAIRLAANALERDERRAAPVHYFKKIADLQLVPLDKLDHFLMDLKAWLISIKHAKALGHKITTPTDVFGWQDDGKHEVQWMVRRTPAEKGSR